MKRLISLLFASILFVSVSAQIPNNGFENWTDMGNFSVPDQWGNLNAKTSSEGAFTCLKGTPGNPGDTYLKLVSKNIGTLGLVPAIAVSGLLDNTTLKPVSGFAFSERPAFLEGNWQFMAYGEDQGYISILLTKWDNGKGGRDTVAYTFYPLEGMVMSWRGFSIAVEYLTGQTPDTAIIVASASNAFNAPTAVNSYIYLDNLEFTGSTAGIGEKKYESFSIYPNPANDYIRILIKANFRSNIKAEILDSEGKIIQEIPSVTGEINISQLASGQYFIRISDGKNESVGKFIKL